MCAVVDWRREAFCKVLNVCTVEGQFVIRRIRDLIAFEMPLGLDRSTGGDLDEDLDLRNGSYTAWRTDLLGFEDDQQRGDGAIRRTVDVGRANGSHERQVGSAADHIHP